jgi:FtsP/CotA-like multicopper oxidase with cupredoxin domain
VILRARIPAAVALVVLAAACSSSSKAASPSTTTAPSGSTTTTSVPPPTKAEQEKGMQVGMPFQEPPVIDSNGTTNDVKFTLNADDAEVSVAGRKAFAMSYNGVYTGPTIHFGQGHTATITLINNLDQPTNMHFHGTHVSPSGNSDDQFLCVAPGKSFTYEIKMPENVPSGTLFYHSHSMATTCPHSGKPDMNMAMGAADVENQMFAGLSGAIVLGDDRAYLPPAYDAITTHTLVLKDVQFDKTNHIVQNNNATGEFINPMNPGALLVSGQLRPVISMQPNETQLWRFVNAGADMAYEAALPGYEFTIINVDGQPMNHATPAKLLSIPPGRRYDVLVTAPAKTGTATLMTNALSTGPQGFQWPDATLATVKIAGAPVVAKTPVTGALPGAAPDLTNAHIAKARTLVLAEGATDMTINGKAFNYAQSIFAEPAVLKTVEEWTIQNTSGEDHPFHLHVSSFQVMSINGQDQTYKGAQDVEWVPHAENGKPGEIVIRIPFTDFTGRYMFHCHIAGHEDSGMMSFINVVAPSGTP